MILTVTLNPSVDHALFVDELKVNDTNRVVRCERDAGGKGVNLSRVVAELGGETVATGFLGGGPGAYIRKVLEVQGVRSDFVDIKGETRVNFSVEDDSGLPPTTLNERGPEVTAVEIDEARKIVSKYAPDAVWIAVGGSLPPGTPPTIYRELGEAARKAGCKVALDADGDALKHGLEIKPDFIKPNEAEAGRLLGREVSTDEEAIAAAKDLSTRAEIVVLSRAEKGAILVSGETVLIGHAPKVEAKSTIGSGDSLVGGMLFALSEGQSLEDAFRLGMAAGAATATTDGSEIARRPVIDKLLPLVKIVREGD